MVEPGVELIIAGLAHLILGILIMRSLKINFKTFYIQHRFKLIAANGLLCLSNVCTGIYFVFYFTEYWDWSYEYYVWVYVGTGINMYIIPSVI